MYAICGMPIIVGKKSAMADFVINNKCGKNISKIASKMALGFYTQNAIRKIEKKIL